MDKIGESVYFFDSMIPEFLKDSGYALLIVDKIIPILLHSYLQAINKKIRKHFKCISSNLIDQ